MHILCALEWRVCGALAAYIKGNLCVCVCVRVRARLGLLEIFLPVSIFFGLN